MAWLLAGAVEAAGVPLSSEQVARVFEVLDSRGAGWFLLRIGVGGLGFAPSQVD
ncbi:hypothetical protein T484DRAFT_1841363 [Baffinella frigidus]|nr:hypothetical protein T484DRAFT_1841363 [Cryptophyta sp. CCMP2293]